MSRLHKTLLVLLTLCATSACKTVSTGPVSDYCLIAQPIAYDSVKDSPETVAAIKKYDSQWACVCEHDCPQSPAPVAP